MAGVEALSLVEKDIGIYRKVTRKLALSLNFLYIYI